MTSPLARSPLGTLHSAVENNAIGVNRSSCDIPFILRRRTFDENQQTPSGGGHSSDVVESLNSSFEAEKNDCIFRNNQSRKHLLHGLSEVSAEEEPYPPQPGTVRKLPRRSSVPAMETPSRLRKPVSHALTAKKSTPASCARRKRGDRPPSARSNRSPFRRVPPKTPRPQFTLQPTATPTPYQPALNKKQVPSQNTATTANTSGLDLTIESDSHDSATLSPVSTPFRFTTFPASLPRVNPRCPATTARKSNTVNRNFLLGSEEDTQNSSISSTMSGQDHYVHMPAPSFPPPVLEWKSPDVAVRPSFIAQKFSEDSDVIPTAARLFPDSSYSEDEDTATASRTRLNFASVPSRDDEESMNRPASPGEVQFRVRLDEEQCSPILREDNGATVMDVGSSPKALSPVVEGFTKNDSSADSSGTFSSKMRRLRPMPDMSAFGEMSRSSDSSTGAIATGPILTCPPTPVRTPAWAHSDIVKKDRNPFVRANSLIITKVLVDNDQSSDEHDEQVIDRRRASLSFSTVEEDQPDNQDTKQRPLSFASEFENLGNLGSGAFADVFKVKSRSDGNLYAVKRNRRQFRGKRDREIALAEVRLMQRIPRSDFVLVFHRAWQEEGYLFCQTELCCRDTCRELLDSLQSQWPTASRRYPSLLKHCGEGSQSSSSAPERRTMPESTVWKICHDVSKGLDHIHSYGIVHNDIKPSNIFLVKHELLGAVCKIGDFGVAGQIGSTQDGQEGDTRYMPPEMLTSSKKHSKADIFSLGLTIYELASDSLWDLPSEGHRWHELRNGSHTPQLSSPSLKSLVQEMIEPSLDKRPSAKSVIDTVEKSFGGTCDDFLKDYLQDIEEYDKLREEAKQEPSEYNMEQTPRNQRDLRTPTPNMPLAPCLFSPGPTVAK